MFINITYVLILCLYCIVILFLSPISYYFCQRYLSFIFNIPLFHPTVSDRRHHISAWKWSFSRSVVLFTIGFRTQLTRVHHVSNHVHGRTWKRQQLTSARGSRGRREEGLQTMGKGSRIITVQPPRLHLRTLSSELLSLARVCACAHAWSFARIYHRTTIMTPTNGYHK